MALDRIKILLADDDKDDCLLFREVLEELQIAVDLSIVNDGQQLLQVLSINNLPDVLFLDLNMPRKNGLECLKAIKTNENLKDLPVVIYSTSFDERVAEQLYQSGAHFYICKPSEFSAMKKVIQQALEFTVKQKSAQPRREKFLIGKIKSTTL